MVSVIDVQLRLVVYLSIMVFDLVDQMVDWKKQLGCHK
jgi:hypothetical protein